MFEKILKPFKKIVGKGENAGGQHFLLFPQCFLLYHSEKSSFWQHLSSANTPNLGKSKVLSFCKELDLLQPFTTIHL